VGSLMVGEAGSLEGWPEGYIVRVVDFVAEVW
jgi:hypothetical protein